MDKTSSSSTRPLSAHDAFLARTGVARQTRKDTEAAALRAWAAAPADEKAAAWSALCATTTEATETLVAELAEAHADWLAVREDREANEETRKAEAAVARAKERLAKAEAKAARVA